MHEGKRHIEKVMKHPALKPLLIFGVGCLLVYVAPSAKWAPVNIQLTKGAVTSPGSPERQLQETKGNAYPSISQSERELYLATLEERLGSELEAEGVPGLPKPQQILLASTWRSGSSFAGELIARLTIISTFC